MSFPKFQKIKWKVTLVILATNVFVLGVAVIAVLIYDSANSKNNLASQIDTIAEITAANSSAALAFRNSQDAQETLDSLRARSEIDYAALFLGKGERFVFFSRSANTYHTATDGSSEMGHAYQDGKLILKRWVDFKGEKVGFIVIHANLKQQLARSKTFSLIAFLSFCGLILVAILLATRLQRLVSDPIARLSDAVRQIIQDKNVDLRVKNTSRDEIGSLVTGFNQMLEEIGKQNRIVVEGENRLKIALSASNMGVWQWNPETNRVFWSGESEKILGEPSPELTLQSFSERIHSEDVNQVIAAIKNSVNNRTAFDLEYRISLSERRVVWLAHQGEFTTDTSSNSRILSGIIQDITSRKEMESERQALVAKLIHAEEEERRRIARELHDTTAQHLAFLKLSFMSVLEAKPVGTSSKLLNESLNVLNTAIQEIRTLSYILHPPVLAEFGLTGALRDFASGISKRSGINVMLHTSQFEGRLPRTIELTLFRVIQESVSNAIHHSGSNEVSIRLARDPEEVRVEIQDFGRGIPNDSGTPDTKFLRNTGVGLPAMEERMALIGGNLIIESDSEGVTVLASVPLSDNTSER